METYTAFVRDTSGSHDTTWISSLEAESIDEAITKAEAEAAEDWGQDADTVKCIGLAHGDIKIAHWDDDN